MPDLKAKNVAHLAGSNICAMCMGAPASCIGMLPDVGAAFGYGDAPLMIDA